MSKVNLVLEFIFSVLGDFPFLSESALSSGSFFHIMFIYLGLGLLDLLAHFSKANILPEMRKAGATFVDHFVDLSDLVSSFFYLLLELLDLQLGFFYRSLTFAMRLLSPELNIPREMRDEMSKDMYMDKQGQSDLTSQHVYEFRPVCLRSDSTVGQDQRHLPISRQGLVVGFCALHQGHR